MGFLYLRFLIGGLNALFVVVIACMTLTLALTISFSSLRDNANIAVSRLGAATAANVDTFFAAPQQRLTALATANERYAGLGTLPSESATFNVTHTNGSPASAGGEILQSYRQLATATMIEAEFRYVSLSLFFLDGCYIWQSVNDQLQLMAVLTTWPTGPLPLQQAPFVPSGHAIPSGKELPAATALAAVYFSGYTFVTDARIPQAGAFFSAYYDIGARSKNSTVSWGQFYFNVIQGREYFVLWLGTKMLNQTGSHLGYAIMMLKTEDVSGILTEGQLTPATRLVIYDTDGFLFGASSGVKTYTSTAFVGPTLQPGCTTTNQSAAHFPSDVSMRACRFHLREAPVALVRDAVRKDEQFFMISQTTGAVKLIGSQYVFVEKLATLEGKRAFTIAMVVPEEDMIGDAKKILPICAGVTAGVVLFVAAVSFVTVWFVLRPLQGIAEHMGKAARLEEDTDAVSISALVEIGDLQRAFLAMRDELSRIRAFVPQSLLRANDTDEDYDDYVDDDDETSHRHDALQGPGGVADSNGNSIAIAAVQDSSASYSRTSASASASASPSAEHRSRRSSMHGHGKPPGAAYVHRRRGSASSARTAESARSARSARPRGKLHLSASVKQENVSVLSLNLRGYHREVKGGLSVEKVASTVETVLRIAQQEKGVVDSFHGDRFMISFNAVKPAANHGIRAAIVAARIADTLTGSSSNSPDKASAATPKSSSLSSSYALPISAGVATGPAQIGNLGSSEMKRFSIVGPVVSQAACLERLCKLYSGAVCLVPQRLFADLRTAVLVKTVDFVRLPFAQSPLLIGAVLRELSHAGDDEWMYQLQQATEENQNNSASATKTDFSPTTSAHTQLSNTVWNSLLQGRFGDAQLSFDELEEKANGQVSPELKKAVKPRSSAVSTTAVDQTGPTITPRDFGPFYTGAVLDADTIQKL